MSDNEKVQHLAQLKTSDKTTSSTCENCHAKVNGSFCSECGQSVESTLKYFWSVVLHLLDDIFSFDSRASRTLSPLLFHPGFLTNEYIAGKRVHYVPPLRLYLFISIVFFISLKFTVSSEDNNILNINAQESVMAKAVEHISRLEKAKKTLKTEQPDNSKALLEISKKIDKFTRYKEDLSKTKNLMLSAIANEIIRLELKKIDTESPLSAKELERFEYLSKKLVTVRNGELVELNEESFSIANNADGTLSFDFLSKERNEKLNAYVKLLSQKANKAFQSDTGPLVQQVIEKLPQLMFLLLPLFALLLKVMFLFSKRLYMEHLTVALHSHSFIFFIILLLEVSNFTQDNFLEQGSSIESILTAFSVALFIWMPIYLFIMQKRVYRQGYFLTLIKYAFIGTSYAILIACTGVVAFIWGLADI